MSLLLGVLWLPPMASAQQQPSLDTLRGLVERSRRAAAAQPSAFDDELAAAITTALAQPDVVGRVEPEGVELVTKLAEMAIAAGRSGEAVAWLRPFDARLASATDPPVRHRLAPTLGAALLAAKQEGEAVARLQPAYDELARHAPATDPLLQSVRRQLAAAHVHQVRWRECLPLALGVVEVDRATNAANTWLIDDLRRVGKAYHGLGRRQDAYDTFEQALQLARKEWPQDDPRVLTALADFAAATGQLGDYRAAYEIYREVLAARERAASPQQDEILYVKQQMSQVLVQLKDLDNACRLQEEVLAALEQAPDRDEYTYVLGLQYYARILFQQRRLDESREVAIDMIRRLEAMLPDDHRDLGNARALLGVLERRRGDLVASRRLLEAAYRGLQQSLTGDHSFTQNACGDLISTCRLQGDVARAAELAMHLLDESIVAVQKSQLASRQTARLVSIHGKGLDHALSLALDLGDVESRRSLVRKAIVVAQWLRGASAHAGRLANRRRVESGAALARSEADIAGAIRTGDGDRVAGLVRDKEALERDDLDRDRLPLPDLAALARALPKGSAAAATVVFHRRLVRAAGAEPLSAAAWVVGLVLLPDGDVRLVDLGGRDELLELVDTMSAATHKQLRSRVIDPLRAAAPEARILYLALDDVLLAVPWDSLPLPSGAMVASEVEVRRLTSLVDLVPSVPPTSPPVAAAARLIAVGDVDFGSAAPADVAVGGPPARGAAAFAALPHSVAEIAEVEQSFQRAFPGAPVAKITGGAATKEALRRAVPGATIVHLATHGFLDATSVMAKTGSVGGGTLNSTSFELAPFSLSGLALAGANRGADAGGQVPGLVTAAELQRFDLDACYLAVVSACESGTGAASSGQGLASLQEALHIAGARYVVAALWPVSDAGSRHFAQAFYAALWQQPDEPYRALRSAKTAAARAGLPFADWAAFQLTGN